MACEWHFQDLLFRTPFIREENVGIIGIKPYVNILLLLLINKESNRGPRIEPCGKPERACKYINRHEAKIFHNFYDFNSFWKKSKVKKMKAFWGLLTTMIRLVKSFRDVLNKLVAVDLSYMKPCLYVIIWFSIYVLNI